MSDQEELIYAIAVRLPQNNRIVIARVKPVKVKPSNMTEDEWLHDPEYSCWHVLDYSKPMTTAQAFKTVRNTKLTKFVLTASVGENLYWFLKREIEHPTPIELGAAGIPILA